MYRWWTGLALVGPAIMVALGSLCGCTASRPSAPRSTEGAHPQRLAPKILSLDRHPPPGGAEPLAVLTIIAEEAERNLRALAQGADQEPYFLAYQVTDTTSFDLAAEQGALVERSDTRRRLLDLDLRVGSPALDNTHPVLDPAYFQGAASLPLEDVPLAIRRTLWWETDRAYQNARARFSEVQAEVKVGVSQDADVPDLSPEPPVQFFQRPASLEVDRDAWEKRVGAYSELFLRAEFVERSFVRLEATASTRTLANTEGTRLQTTRAHARLSFGATSSTADGSELERSAELDAEEVGGLPSDASVRARIGELVADLRALREAPKADPFVGPAILEGKAAAVFFHEIFGHRVEGHRQKGDLEGQTFSDKLGLAIMDRSFDVYDDPRIRAANGLDLIGYYTHDDEGVAASRARLIEDGVFRGFLLSRAPIRGFASSNGHGRREAGYRVASRQANLVVDPGRLTSRADLDAALLREIRRQRKPYGLRVGEVTGGFTMTQRGDPQAFKVLPVMVYRVFPEGRQELVRGVSLEGTPLSVLADIMGAANDFAIFNGYCDAESGEVPVSAVSPSLLVRRIEVTRDDEAGERPPLLPSPPVTPRSSAP